jgi:hypothetical protein
MVFNPSPQFKTMEYKKEEDTSSFVPADAFLKDYLIAQKQKLTPVQAAAQNFGDLPVIGPMLQVIRDYEDRVNYRDADPKLRKMMHLE